MSESKFLAATYHQQRQTLLQLPDAQLEILRRAVDDELFRRATPKKRKVRAKTKH